jgi:hypothetical protein
MQVRPDIHANTTARLPLRRLPYRARQAGAGMVDLIMYIFGVVAIVGFVFWMKSVAWGPLMGWMEATAMSTQISKIETVYSGAANYAGLTTANMATPSIFPAKYLPGGGVVNNRFGGGVTLAIATISTTNDTIQYINGGVRSDSCTTIVNQLVDDADRISVAGTVVKAHNGNLDAATMKTRCDSDNAVVIMVERIKRS